MKRLNPLYIILLFVTIVFISFFMLNEEEKNFNEKIKNLNSFESKTKDFKELKTSWSNKEFVNSNLDLILKNRMFSNQKVLRVATKDIVKVKIESSDPKVLDNFLNKILNKQFIIKRLELQKSYISLEIGVK